MTRREFIHRGAMLAAAAPVLRPVRARAPTPLRVGVVDAASGAQSDVRLGIELGVDEARHAAQLFGGMIELTTVSKPSAHDRELSALVGGADADACAAWADHAKELGIVYLNVGCTNDALRGAKCNRAAFHVIPSDSMYRDALALAGAAGASSHGAVTAWDSSLSRFGADTLNQRFRARFNRSMTSESWTAWVAIKILWEATLRAKSTEGRALASYLERETTQFDGHKGQPLSFRAWDHQLRQPVYVLSAESPNGRRAVREVPDVSAAESPRDALDRIGVGSGTSACRFER